MGVSGPPNGSQLVRQKAQEIGREQTTLRGGDDYSGLQMCLCSTLALAPGQHFGIRDLKLKVNTRLSQPPEN
jgi:hypothetical protein